LDAHFKSAGVVNSSGTLRKSGGTRQVEKIMKRHKTFVAVLALLLTTLPGYGLLSEMAADRRIMPASAEVSAASFAAPTPSPSPGVTYTVTDLGTLGGGGGVAHGINNSGQVIGEAALASGQFHAFIWENGTMIDLGTLGGSRSKPFSINGAGQVVGSSDDASNLRSHAFLWQRSVSTPNGAITDLGTFPVLINPNHSTANGINDSGQIVGVGSKEFECGISPTGSPVICGAGRAARWQNGGMDDLGALSGNSTNNLRSSVAEGINNSGQVVGHSESAPGQFRAFLLQNGTMTSLGTLGGMHSKALDINDSGQVVGFSSMSGCCADRAFLWQNGTMINLGTLGRRPGPGSSEISRAQAINSTGQVVGNTSTTTSDGHAFLWQNGTMTDLNSLIPADSGWELLQANDINDAGQIVGSGRFNGQIRAFLLTPKRTNPLIFIHGVGGSVLKDSGEEVWLAPFADRHRLSLFPQDNPSSGIRATDTLRYATNPITGNPITDVGAAVIYGPLLERLTGSGYRDYLVDGNPNRLTAAGCDTAQRSDDPNQNPNFFVFAYDWRKNNVENAQKLKDFVICVEQFHPDAKLDILTHSMGSLLARRYILDNPDDHKVDKLITIGAPWLGAPKPLNVVETGDFVPLIASGPAIKYIAPSLTATHQLLASRAYFALGGQPMFAEEGWDYDGDGNDREVYSYDGVLNFLNTKYPSTTPGATAEAFHSYVTARGAQDDWSDDSTGVKYFHIYGVQAGNLTISQTVATTETVCRPNPGSDPEPICETKHILQKRFTVGDGTVPPRSAGRRTGSADYNAPNAQLFRFAVSDAEDNNSVEHTGLCSNLEVQDKILELLGQSPQAQARAFGVGASPFAFAFRAAEEAAPLAPQANEDEQPSTVPSYYLTVIGGSTVVVSDKRGASTALIAGDLKGSVPNVQTLTLGDKAEMVTLPVSLTEEYSVTFRSDGSPVAIELVKGVDNETPTEVIRYTDTVLPAAVTAQLKILPEGVDDLRYDADGDGTFETALAPSVALSGEAAKDVTPPAVQLSSAAQQIIVNASDTESIVKSVHYSLDGRSFKPYTGPVTVTSAQPVTVHAFADDAAGNRSAPATYTFTPPSDAVAPMTAATLSTASNAAGWHNADVTVSLNSTDAGSGVQSIAYTVSGPQSFSGDTANGNSVSIPVTAEGTTTITFFSTDMIGNAEAAQTITVRLDKTAPTINGSRSPAPNASGWHNADVTVSFTCADAVSGVAICSDAVPVGTEGQNQIATATAVDLAGNSASATVGGINIDKTAPSISASRAPASNVHGWNNTDVLAGYSASDTLSGLASPPAGSHVFNSEGVNQSHTFNVSDLAGNSASASVGGVNIDKTAPSVACPPGANATAGTGGQVPVPDLRAVTSVSDNFTPTASLVTSQTPTPGTPVGAGAHTVNLIASDQAGNTGSCTTTFTVTAPTPDKIVFESSRNGNLEIYVVNADGGNLVRLTSNSAADTNPVWSPDRGKIAFTSLRTGNSDIYVMNADGSNQTRLTTSTAFDAGPAWSPDGTKIAFWSLRNGNAEIYVMNGDGSSLRRLTSHPGADIQPSWSPDGTRIVFTSNRAGALNPDIYVINEDGSGVTRLTSHVAADDSPDWSPDGTKIAFTSNRTGLLDFEIWVMGSDGTNPVRLTSKANTSVRPCWSRDGAKITFATNRDGLLNFEIYTMSADGSNQARLTSHAAFDFAPCW
jgi:probable HAF family extracellular repeat protein